MAHSSVSSELSANLAKDWSTLSRRFKIASEALLSRRQLGRRTDSKFLVPDSLLLSVIENLRSRYMTLGDPADYNTLYYDTPNLDCFHAHRRGFRIRHKVRVRQYTDRKLSFLEIKSRRSTIITEKKRIEREFGESGIKPAEQSIICNHIGQQTEFRPVAWTHYSRFTLVNTKLAERVTFDAGLSFSVDNHRITARPKIIIEVKQSPVMRDTPIMITLRELGIRPVSASKYCSAIVSLYPEQRHNRLRPSVTRLIGGN